MATWRNGSAFGFDRQRYQKVAGSSPAVVILLPLLQSHACFPFFDSTACCNTVSTVCQFATSDA